MLLWLTPAWEWRSWLMDWACPWGPRVLAARLEVILQLLDTLATLRTAI